MAPADVVPDPQAVSTGGAHVLAIAASWVATILLFITLSTSRNAEK
jgi:hypothetical protein